MKSRRDLNAHLARRKEGDRSVLPEFIGILDVDARQYVYAPQ